MTEIFRHAAKPSPYTGPNKKKRQSHGASDKPNGVVVNNIMPAGLRSGLQILSRLNESMDAVQLRLQTGKRVNSASDNPSAYFTAQGLTNRAADIQKLMDSFDTPNGAIKAASTGLESVEAMIKSMQGAAQQALQASGSNARVTGTVSGLTLASSPSLANGKTITINDGTTTATFTMAAGLKVQDFLNTVNGTSGLKIKAGLSASGQVTFEALSSNSIVIGGTANNPELASLGLASGTTTGSLNTARQAMAAIFESMRIQLDETAKDATYNGVNLLQGGTLNVTFNENATSKYNFGGVMSDAASLGIASTSPATSHQFQSDTEINSFLTSLNSALATIRTQASTIGSASSIISNRETFMSSMIEILQSGSDDLVLSDLDADSALYLALQTRQQIATSAIAFTAQREQSALKLLGLA